MRTAILFASLVAALSLCLPAQTFVVPGALANVGGPSGNTVFMGLPLTSNTRTLQFQLAASQFAAFPAGEKITGLSFRLRNAAGTPASFPPLGGMAFSMFDVTFGPANLPLAAMSTNFSSNYLTLSLPGLGSFTNATQVRAGPLFMPAGGFVSGASPNPFGTTIEVIPYLYQGGDLVVTIRFAATSLASTALELDAFPPGVAGAAVMATSNAASSGFFTSVPIVRFTTRGEFQRNQVESHLNHDGIQTTGESPALLTVCSGQTLTASVASTRAGFPADIAVTFAPLVGRSAVGSTALQDGQLFNIPLGAPSLFFLFSGNAIPAMPPLANFSVPFQAPPGPLTWSSQLIVIDPTRASFLSLSQGNQVEVVAATTSVVAGPVGDDTSVTVRIGAPPLCGLGSVVFYGSSYTEFHVSSNGRVTFGGQDSSFSPTLAQAAAGRPFVGFWTDLTPGASGSVAVSSGTTSLTVNYTSMVYAQEAAAATFGIRFESSGAIGISGLGTIATNPLLNVGPAGGDAQMLGICRGTLGTNIQNGAFPFGSSVTGGPGVGLVDFWSGAVATRPNGIGLVRTIQDNQLAFGQGRLDFTPIGLGYQALNH